MASHKQCLRTLTSAAGHTPPVVMHIEFRDLVTIFNRTNCCIMAAQQVQPSNDLTGQLRVISLLPSATEILCFIGGGHLLVGRSHECDYPESITDRPVLTRAINTFASSQQMHDAVSDAMSTGKVSGIQSASSTQAFISMVCSCSRAAD